MSFWRNWGQESLAVLIEHVQKFTSLEWTCASRTNEVYMTDNACIVLLLGTLCAGSLLSPFQVLWKQAWCILPSQHSVSPDPYLTETHAAILMHSKADGWKYLRDCKMRDENIFCTLCLFLVRVELMWSLVTLAPPMTFLDKSGLLRTLNDSSLYLFDTLRPMSSQCFIEN